MAKLIIFSIVLVSFAVPIGFSSALAPRRALRRVQVILLVFMAVWATLCLVWYPQLVTVE